MNSGSRLTFWTKAASALRHELWSLGAISLYLYCYFAAILLYKWSILREAGIAYAPFGIAIVKALVLGKFIVIGNAMHLGDRSRRLAMIWHVLHKIIVFVALLFLLSSLEEGIVSLIHGHSFHEAVSRFAAETWQQVAAACLLGFLALAPLFGIEAVVDALGVQNFRRLVFGRPGPTKPA